MDKPDITWWKLLLGDNCSTPWPLVCRDPHGAILSPLLFNIYRKPLGGVVRGFGLNCDHETTILSSTLKSVVQPQGGGSRAVALGLPGGA